ncbi:MAG: hypothetical protein LBS77_05135 [Desulfovibrio sp.]|jgi:hypothetical protein|nr:hypothetical protein [Desulfovibrio sp.]
MPTDDLLCRNGRVNGMGMRESFFGGELMLIVHWGEYYGTCLLEVRHARFCKSGINANHADIGLRRPLYGVIPYKDKY